MDPNITDLVHNMDFVSIPELKGLSNTEKSLNHCSARLKHGATAQGNVDSNSDSTIDPKQLVTRNNKSETRESFTYLEEKISIPKIEINRSSSQRLRASVTKGEQDVMRDSCDDDDVKEYSIFQVPDDPNEFCAMCGAPIGGGGTLCTNRNCTTNK